MSAAYIIDIVRTPVGKYGGSLAHIRPDDLAAFAIKGLLDRHLGLDTGLIEEVILGAANQAGEDNRNVGRMAALLAGLPVSVAGSTVNRLCASGLEAIAVGARNLQAGAGLVYIAGGVESMSRAPYVMAKPAQAYDRQPQIFDTTLGWRFTNPILSGLYHPYSMGETAENVAKRWGISRDAQDAFAHQSQLRWQAAHLAGRFGDELLKVPLKTAKDGSSVYLSQDEHPRLSSIEQLSGLKPAFLAKNGSVTAGNSSGLNDGSAMCLLASEQAIGQLSLTPMARIVSVAVAGLEPEIMGMGPVVATQKALWRAGLKVKDIGLIELNEAFAAQALACIQNLDLDPQIININGGAIAIGHPLGASGVRISATLLHQMKQKNIRYGLATMCVGVGQGMSIIYENCM